jgi:hypothetical protein
MEFTNNVHIAYGHLHTVIVDAIYKYIIQFNLFFEFRYMEVFLLIYKYG